MCFTIGFEKTKMLFVMPFGKDRKTVPEKLLWELHNFPRLWCPWVYYREFWQHCLHNRSLGVLVCLANRGTGCYPWLLCNKRKRESIIGSIGSHLGILTRIGNLINFVFNIKSALFISKYFQYKCKEIYI